MTLIAITFTDIQDLSGHPNITYHINTKVFGAAAQYFDGFFESNSQHWYVIMAGIVTSADGLRKLEQT